MIVTALIMPKGANVLKQSEEVSKPAEQMGIETHLATIESEIKLIKSALFFERR